MFFSKRINSRIIFNKTINRVAGKQTMSILMLIGTSMLTACQHEDKSVNEQIKQTDKPIDNTDGSNINNNRKPPTLSVTHNQPTPSVIWDKAIQQAVVTTAPGPTVASRSYALMHTAMYDAWSAYANTPISTTFADSKQRPAAENTDANKTTAMSHAAYQIGIALYPTQKAIFTKTLTELNLKADDNSQAAILGREFAAELLKLHTKDVANIAVGYVPHNPPGITKFIDKWTPDVILTNDGKHKGHRNQAFLTPQWGQLNMFNGQPVANFRPVKPQPFLNEAFKLAVVDVDNKTIKINGKTQVISSDLVGTVINQKFIDQATHIIDISANLTEKQKLIAEFWEDANGTSFPPGTWMSIGQYVSNRDGNSLDQDAQMFFMLGNAVCDAGIAVWDSKVYYGYTRPFAAIRTLGKLGLIGNKNADGDYEILAYDGTAKKSGRILATQFITYQTPHSDFSPPFAEYVSGHSGFSAAAATVLQKFTGSDTFGASYTFPTGSSRFEMGITPKHPLTLSWDTFSQAATEAGISRLYGGIHFTEGNVNGSKLGNQVGQAVYAKAQTYITGTAKNTNTVNAGMPASTR